MKTRPYWLEDSRSQALPQLERQETADAVVIGGGITGLTVAQLLSDRGLDVIVLERQTCGSGATGRSSGFITPDSELQVAQLVNRFGVRDGAFLWRAAASACDHIRRTIEEKQISCDLIEAESMFVANGRSGQTAVAEEHEARRKANLPSKHYSEAGLQAVIAADGFAGGVRYGNTFAITAHRFALSLRDRLRAAGVRIYEQSAVRSVTDHAVTTDLGWVRARLIFFCADCDLASLGNVRRSAHYAQTFLAATLPLPQERFRQLFPHGDLLVWDSDLLYHYFRRTADDRLLIGGGLLRNTYGPPADGSTGVPSLRRYVQLHLPQFADVEFDCAWSGLIGVTKDLLPIAGRDMARSNHYYAGCAAGIPWSVVAAQAAVAAATGEGDDFRRFFDPHRAFTDLDPLQTIARKPVTFALAHAYTKGALRGSAADVKRRRPYAIGGVIVATILAWMTGRIILKAFWKSRSPR